MNLSAILAMIATGHLFATILMITTAIIIIVNMTKSWYGLILCGTTNST